MEGKKFKKKISKKDTILYQPSPLFSATLVEFIGPYSPGPYQPIPFLSTHVPAGLPVQADDFVENRLDLNSLVIKHPGSTFFVRADGDSMTNAGIQSGDILIVDRAVEIDDKCIVIAVVDGEFTVKRLRRIGNEAYLVPENPEYEPTLITEEMSINIWGVVTHVIHTTH